MEYTTVGTIELKVTTAQWLLNEIKLRLIFFGDKVEVWVIAGVATKNVLVAYWIQSLSWKLSLGLDGIGVWIIRLLDSTFVSITSDKVENLLLDLQADVKEPNNHLDELK